MSTAGTRLKRRLLIGAGTNWLAFAATLAVAFFLTPYLVRKLGDGQFGIWAFVESILAYFTLFDLGIAACVVRFVARFHANGDRADLNRLVSTAFALFLGLGGAVFVLGLALFPFLLSRFSSDVLAFAFLMLANLALTLPLSVFPSILDGLERFALKSGIRISILALRTAGTVWVMEKSPSLLNLGILFTACNMLEHGLFATASFRSLPFLELRRRHVDRETIKRVRGYSLHAFLAMVAGRTCTQSGILIVGFFFGAAPVTYFAIALRLVEFAKALLRTATNTLTPAVSVLEAKGDGDSIRKMFVSGTRWVLYLVLPIQVGLVVFGRPFLAIWLGDPAYAEQCYPALVVLSSTLSLVVAQSISARILYGLGHLRVFARAALLEALANVSLGILLCPRYGLLGVAIATAIPNFVMCLWVIQHTARRIGYPWMQPLQAWLRPIALVTIPAAVWSIPNWAIAGWWEFTLALKSGLVPYTLAVFLMELPRRSPFMPFRTQRKLLPWRSIIKTYRGGP